MNNAGHNRFKYEYTFNVDNNIFSSRMYSIYYTNDYKDMEYDFRYTFTQGKVTQERDSRKERNKED